ncbi:hypothetical protein FM036_27760 [Nostoc sp. HG1]|nr:hypothetical protein [Nostoc sp. HG1]
MGSIISRTSQLDPDVPISVHPAPDVLSLRFCSCVCNRGNFSLNCFKIIFLPVGVISVDVIADESVLHR